MNDLISGSIDLHMHTSVSDGTDTPEGIIRRIKEAGISLFSVTDHDSVKSAVIILRNLRSDDPRFITGVEFSCRDELGKYHILGYGYRPASRAVRRVADKAHAMRENKVRARLEFINREFGFSFTDSDVRSLLSEDNPGKPHIANLMVRHGYAETKEQAIKEFINRIRFRTEYVRPEEAIRGILGAGGIPVLAHPSYGDGDQLILGEEMDARIRRLTDLGLQGLEAYYSGFPPRLRREILAYAERYGLYVTAGSDYHGTNKLVPLGDTGLDFEEERAEGLQRFLHDAERTGKRAGDA